MTGNTLQQNTRAQARDAALEKQLTRAIADDQFEALGADDLVHDDHFDFNFGREESFSFRVVDV